MTSETSIRRTKAPEFVGEVMLARELPVRSGLTHVVFDFDGTLSWLRHGWPELMLSVFHRHLGNAPRFPAGGWDEPLGEIVWGMNGQPTLKQMTRFAAFAMEYGVFVPSPRELLKEFQDQLDARIAERLALIRAGGDPDELVVFGARPFLEFLRAKGLTLVILSSTIEHRVREEAQALGIAGYFGEHIYGSPMDPIGFTKKAVLERLIGAEGQRLLSFGDGPVEIAATKELGGLAIAVCTDEDHNGSGRMDEQKRLQLMAAGADAALPDFRDAIAFTQMLLG
ncbi:MAG: HAD family hydrolase [Chthoniobacteraceae bacterium]